MFQGLEHEGAGNGSPCPDVPGCQELRQGRPGPWEPLRGARRGPVGTGFRFWTSPSGHTPPGPGRTLPSGGEEPHV